jgi:hypothetical protein
MFPEVSGAKSVTHNQFMQLRDSYKSEAFLNRLVSPEPEQESKPALNMPVSASKEAKEVVAQETSPAQHVHRKPRKQKRPAPLPIGYNTLGINEDRKVLYRNFHEVSQFVYLVELSRCKHKIFLVLFEHYQQPNRFIADVLNEKIASRLLS